MLQFSAVTRLPVLVQIKYHGKDPVLGARMLVQMSFVKRSFRIDRKVPFELKEAEEKPSVEN